MHYCVTYDIRNDRLRRRTARWCKQAGLLRLQRSVFVGTALKRLIEDLETQVRAEMRPDDRLCILPLSNEAWNRMQLFGEALPKDQLDRSEVARYF
jgi:CRISPR-associated protein Cas2